MFERFFELPLDRWNLFDSINLRRARIVLVSDLSPTIDFFNAEEVGIGGRNAEQAASELNLSADDKEKLAALLRLRSFDVYTLRAAMSDHMSEQEFEKLALPDDERAKLEEYTRDYTRALFKLIFEDGKQEAGDRASMRAMLEGNNKEIVTRNVMALAKKFEIQPEHLVNYIAGLGEMILAIGFYRRCFEDLRKPLETFLLDIKALYDDPTAHFRHPQLKQRCYDILMAGTETVKSLNAFFEGFKNIGSVWVDITPERFKDMRDSIEDQYPSVGAVLCIWQVKIAAWNHRFRTRSGRLKESTTDQRVAFMVERVTPNLKLVESHLKNLHGLKLS